MKILCIADEKDNLIYSGNIKPRFGNIDMVLSAGDLDLDYYGFIVSSLNKPLLFVFGNHNLSHLEDFERHPGNAFERGSPLVQDDAPSYGSIHVGGRVVNVRGLIVAGLGGSIRYNDGQNQFTEVGMFFYALRLLPKLLFNRIFHGRYLDILLTHASPAGIQDGTDRAHRGFKVFLWFMKLFKPKYLVHGHIHLYDINATRISTYRKTKVVNAYEHCVIDTEE